MTYALWIVQALLALLFLFAGGLFAAFVAYGRWRLGPSPRRPER